mmetsp:Transcript_8055/g.8307  ORF Transcript_8055/g.8307 Transcript_8055/m.8307 type:complete len:439 (+) Transcript_8055:1-1317(+)
MDNIILTGMRNPIYIDVQINSDKLEDNFITSLSKPNRELVTVVDDYFNKISEIKSISQEVPKQLENRYIMVNSYTQKLPILISILLQKVKENKKVMVFMATCNSVDYYNIVLDKLFDNQKIEGKEGSDKEVNSENIPLFKLHSKISQKKRKKEYQGFLKAKAGVLLTTDLSSRGIDIPDLDVIIQFDPPKNEESFVHRVGRTARVGRKGESLLFIQNNNEKKFINYLDAKSIVLGEKPIRGFFPSEISDEEGTSNIENNPVVENYKKALLSINTSDKWIYDKAVKAFVSFIKFYSEHDLKYIFDVKLLDIGDYANSLQLVRLPRVKEILGKKIKGFEKNSEIDPSKLEYLDSNVKSQMEEKKKKIEQKREEKAIKHEWAELQKEKKNSRNKQDKKRTKKRNEFKEWDDFAEEERLYKKLKTGKISKEEYDKIFMKNIH